MRARRVLLLRHPSVAAAWRGRCYGRSDVPLGSEGRTAARALAATAPLEEYDRVVASPLRRARWPGALLARRRGVALGIEPLLAERGFGTWEGMRWDAIWAAEGAAMDGILDHPDRFRPGGGETTAELGRRVMAWWDDLPQDGAVLAVAHGGPIGALAGLLRGEGPRGWLSHVPREGEGVLVERGTGAPPTVSRWAATPERAGERRTAAPG